jgi:nitrogen regulatory protein P-II 2
MIIAYIKPFKLDPVRKALIQAGVDGLTITEVRGHGRQLGKMEIYRGQEYEVPLIPKIRLEAVIPDDVVGAVLTAIEEEAATGKIGDGKIFVVDVSQALRIRTGETGVAAL